MIEQIFAGLIMLTLMITCHELGHWFVFKFRGIEYKFKFNKSHQGFLYDDYKQTPQVNFLIYVIAIFAGFIPYMIIPIITNVYVDLAVIGLYLWGCTFDAVEAYKILKEGKVDVV